MKAVETVETVLWFPRSLWTRSLRPQLRQFPQPARRHAVRRVCSTRSAALPGVPWGPCAPAPLADMRPGEVVRGVHPVGSCAIERQYRGDGAPRDVEQSRGEESEC